MKQIFVTVTVLLVLFGVTAYATAGIYKLVDENGRVTYTNAPAKGAQKLQLGVSAPSVPRAVAKATIATPLVTMEGFPKVSATQQKRRDDKRRQILENELVEETKHLTEMQRALDDATKSIQRLATNQVGLMFSVPFFEAEKIKKLRKQVSLHESNILALHTELEKL